MGVFTRNVKENPYDHLIEAVILKMNMADEGTDEYKELLGNLERLERLNKDIHEPLLDANKALVVAGNLAGILAILHYEKLGFIASKALPLIMKVK